RKQSRVFVQQVAGALKDGKLDEAIAIAERNKKSHIAKVVATGLSEFQSASQQVSDSDVIDAAKRGLERSIAIVHAEMKRGLPGRLGVQLLRQQSGSLRRRDGQLLDGVDQLLYPAPRRQEVTAMAYKPQVGAQMAAPNVIPMADIMLVLLIIFMVVTPMLQKTHQVDLAPTNNPHDMKDADKDDAIVVAISRDGSIFLGNAKLRKEEITDQVKDRISTRLDKTVYVKSDARAKYGDV